MNVDVLSHIKEFVSEDYIYFAPVSREWNAAWGENPKLTRAITQFTTLPQVFESWRKIKKMNSFWYFVPKLALEIFFFSNMIYLYKRFNTLISCFLYMTGL